MMLKRWDAFARFLDDGRVCLSNNAAELGLCAVALGRKSWLFADSDRGGERAALVYSLQALEAGQHFKDNPRGAIKALGQPGQARSVVVGKRAHRPVAARDAGPPASASYA